MDGSILLIHGRRWYRLLVVGDQTTDVFRGARPLFVDYPIDTLSSKLLVCFTPQLDDRVTRLFSVFNTYVDFYKYVELIDVEQRSFYEIIIGEQAQKPHFDIDVSISELEPTVDAVALTIALRDAVISGVADTLASMGVSLNLDRDLLLYTSHGMNKQSIHLVIGTYCHSNNREAKEFYRRVMERVTRDGVVSPAHLRFIDGSVYSTLQQFRILGSRKIGSDRVKQFQPVFEYRQCRVSHVYPEVVTTPAQLDLLQLLESLCSIAAGATRLPALQEERPSVSSFCPQDINENGISKALEHVNKQHFQVRTIQGNRIELRRLVPTYCTVCRRTHEHDNPFITLYNGTIYWHCRHGKPIKLTTLDPDTIDADTDPDSDRQPAGCTAASNDEPVCVFGNMVLSLDGTVRRLDQSSSLPIEVVRRETRRDPIQTERPPQVQQLSSPPLFNPVVVQARRDPIQIEHPPFNPVVVQARYDPIQIEHPPRVQQLLPPLNPAVARERNLPEIPEHVAPVPLLFPTRTLGLSEKLLASIPKRMTKAEYRKQIAQSGCSGLVSLTNGSIIGR
jgi:hypothetical protein